MSDLVDVKILAYELGDRYADLLALKRDMRRYSKSKSTIDRGNFLRFLVEFQTGNQEIIKINEVIYKIFTFL